MIRKLTLATVLAPTTLAAQDLPTAAYLPLDMATKAAQVALGACAADGYNVSVAIVARDGATKVHLKADNSGPHTVGSAQGKAFTSASMGRDTAGLANFIGENPQHDGLRYMDNRMVIQGGGLPIKISGALVGGIGVGGAPGGHLDEACARAGLDAIGAE
ncbi:heme-binding protein [Alisedimentitalea sp. MJ-SS2]|uniref:GlcG/HbpS family heme-binding protein n=1 Tax=Aliisedimentitalea sp. MJ-SS2 TaxID=3049795 RepID=UPI0029089886|nr:heme-binding protein [Alisedimentitalea sp. MJ-SS2]MDU8928805.1 heme-binding protein [Alisedimentitalea sp. MJ-SS2]